MQKRCFHCASEKIVKNGYVFGRQRYKCQACGYQFTKESPHGKPISIKLICHELYLSGLSMRQIAEIVGVTPQSVSRWLKKWHEIYLSEISQNSTLYLANKESLSDCLDISFNNKVLVSSQKLPSGAKFNIVIELPSKSLKK